MPAEGIALRSFDNVIEIEFDDALCTLVTVYSLVVPDDLRFAGELQYRPVLEVGEQQPRVRMRSEIAERVEHVVPRIVRERDSLLVDEGDEPGVTASMGNIRSMIGMEARYKERIRSLQPFLLGPVEGTASLDRI